MTQSYEFTAPERVLVGTVGEPGQRMFFLQAREATTMLTLKMEKRQVGALSQHLAQLLQDLARPGELPSDEFLEPEDFVEPAFVVGSLAVAYDAQLDRIVLLIDERLADDEVGDDARLLLTREQAAALAIHGTRLVEAGRPPCPLCGYPLDPRGHACPRTNGHRPPVT